MSRARRLVETHAGHDGDGVLTLSQALAIPSASFPLKAPKLAISCAEGSCSRTCRSQLLVILLILLNEEEEDNPTTEDEMILRPMANERKERLRTLGQVRMIGQEAGVKVNKAVIILGTLRAT